MTGLNVTPTAWPGSPQADVAGGDGEASQM